jgi:heat shock protein HslJ
MTDPTPDVRSAATSDALAGTQWQITELDGAPVTESEDALLVGFGHDGRVSGSTGVNQFTASYSMNATYVTFGPMALTRRAGPPELAAQEAVIVGSLAGACTYHLERTRLVVDGPSGAVQLRAVGRAPDPDPAVGVDLS